jgi:hypothetical protein
MHVRRSRIGISNVVSICAGIGMLVPMFGWAQGADDQYDVTIKMAMVGVPMEMPAISQRLCVKKGASDGDFIPRQDNCTVTDAKRAGARLTFKIACAGKDPMTGTGDFTFDANGYSGQIRLKGKMDGEDVDMTQGIAARRAGACTAR